VLYYEVIMSQNETHGMTESNRIKPIGEEIDDLWKIREEIRALKDHAVRLQKDYDAAEFRLRERMEREALPKASGRFGNVTQTSSVVPTVKDWDAFYSFIKRHNYFHLLERRPSVSGCRELFEMKSTIPGVEPFTKVGLRLVTSGDDK
jgi:hypothetical protein